MNEGFGPEFYRGEGAGLYVTEEEEDLFYRIEEDGVMPFWFINLLIQRQFLVFFLWRLRIILQGDIT